MRDCVSCDERVHEMCFVEIYEILIYSSPHRYVLASLNRDYHEEKLAGKRWNRDTYNLRYDFCYTHVCLYCLNDVYDFLTHLLYLD